MKAETKPRVSHRPAAAPDPGPKHVFLWAALLIIVCLSVLFWKSFDSAYIHFSNDGPLGAMVAEQNSMPAILKGLWMDLNWLGSEGLSPSPTVTTFMRFLGPYVYGRILPPAALFIVGIAACFCFRKFKLAPLACVLGGLAAALNSDFFSTCTWGVASQIVGFGANYVALGLLAEEGTRGRWQRTVLAGFAVGIGIMEAYDIGAIFSLFVAAFIVYREIFLREKISSRNAIGGFGRVAIVALFAAFISAHALTTLVGTQLKGVVAAERDMQTPERRWQFATQWSLPKAEALQIIVPGIFGYRMDSPQGDNYWGTIGSSPQLEEAEKQLNDPNPQVRGQAKETLTQSANWRISGTGYYAGVLVVLIAIWAALQSFRGERSVFTRLQRRMVWFWFGVAVICIPLAFGRYAPFYQFFYALPYASTIRNPTKFLHVFSWVLIILFAYGAHGLIEVSRAYAERGSEARESFKKGLAKAAVFDRRFLAGCGIAIIASGCGWFLYAQKNVQADLIKYMVRVGIDPTIAVRDAEFSLQAVGWFILLLILGTALFAAIVSGRFTGTRARWLGWALGALLVFDLGRADAPWVLYWNIADKYATNPIIDLFRDRPYEHRVDILPFGSFSEQMKIFRQVYALEWSQQLFPYYNIQSLQVVMEPRVSVDKYKFLQALPWTDPANIVRTWELTNTRYLVGDGGPDFVTALNQKFDPLQHRFHLAKLTNGEPANFNLALKPGHDGSAYSDYTATNVPNSELGVIEFTGALPRAKLFSNWQINTNDDEVLKTIASANFDPHRVVIVSDAEVPPPVPTDTFREPGTVTIDPNYRSKRIELTAEVQTPAILLLSERYNPKWKVEVDGQPAELLRCDYIMRGIQLKPGHHKIVLHFESPIGTLYVSLIAIAMGIGLTAWVACRKEDEGKETW
ncbi:MAG TPA: hypothetical protein VH413_10800 [Verrucomicrobiae bacterium]|jgi:hypothetical protein|nr:hypothetical protein [Verrucomicrobiae bacterium]